MTGSGFSQSPQHVLKNTAVFEVFDFHVSVQTHLHLERFSGVGCHLYVLVHLEVTFADVDVEILFACQAWIGRGVPRESALSPDLNSRGRMPMPARLLLWILSKDWAMTALIP